MDYGDTHLSAAESLIVEARDGPAIGAASQHIVLLPVVASSRHPRIVALDEPTFFHHTQTVSAITDIQPNRCNNIL